MLDDYAAFKQAVAYLDLEVVIGFTVLGADKDAGLQAGGFLPFQSP